MPDADPDFSQAELYDRWTAADGRNKDRPAFVREYREAFAAYTSTSDPVPSPDASLKRYREWLERYRGTVTRQINDSEETDPHDESDDLADESDA